MTLSTIRNKAIVSRELARSSLVFMHIRSTRNEYQVSLVRFARDAI